MANRNYRPTSFNDVVGNKKVVDEIKNNLNSNRNCNKILLMGSTGVGKTTLARIISSTILNEPDYNRMVHSFSYNEINCSLRNQIDYTREFIEKLAYRGFAFGKRVYFFDECAALTKDSQRALLKAIEDSPDIDYFIFATSEPEKILKPLIKRFSNKYLEDLTEEDIVFHLERIAKAENIVVDKRILHKIVVDAEVDIRQSEYLLQDYISLPEDEKIALLMSLPDINCKDETLIDNPDNALEPNKKPQLLQLPPPDNVENIECSDAMIGDSGLVAGLETPVVSNLSQDKLSDLYEAINRTAFTSTAMLKVNFPEPRSFMAPFINEGSLTMIYSAAGVGKSWFSLLNALALTRVNGRSFELSTFRVAEQCGVVIIDGEMPRYQLQQRLASLAGPLGDENAQTPLTIITSESLVADVDQAIDLDNEDWRNSIYAFMKNNPQNKVIILDNWSSLSGGGSESSREAIVPINRWLLSLKRLGLAIVLIHHSNKSGGYRGHSSRIDNLDTVISLTKMKKTDELCFKVDFIKARTAKPGDAQTFVLEAVPHPDNPKWLSWKCYNEQADKKASRDNDNQIIAYLMLNDITQNEIAELFEVSQAKISNLRRKAIKAGYLTKEGIVTHEGNLFIASQGIAPDAPGYEVTK